MTRPDEDCLRGVIAETRKAIDADEWTTAYVRLLKLNYCDQASACGRAAECANVRDVFRRNIDRVTRPAAACG